MSVMLSSCKPAFVISLLQTSFNLRFGRPLLVPGMSSSNLFKGSSRIVISFTSVHSVRREGGGLGSAYAFLKMSFVMHCHFGKGSHDQHVQSTILLGRESQKIVLCVCP